MRPYLKHNGERRNGFLHRKRNNKKSGRDYVAQPGVFTSTEGHLSNTT